MRAISRPANRLRPTTPHKLGCPAAADSTPLGLPNCSLNRRSFPGGFRSRRAIEQETTGRRGGGKREIGVRALRAKKPASLESSAGFQGNIFGFGPPKTKMRSRLPCRPSPLPAFLFSRKGFGTSCQLDGRPRRSFIMAFGRHSSFCERAAAGQPRDVGNRQEGPNANVPWGGEGRREITF